MNFDFGSQIKTILGNYCNSWLIFSPKIAFYQFLQIRGFPILLWMMLALDICGSLRSIKTSTFHALNNTFFFSFFICIVQLIKVSTCFHMNGVTQLVSKSLSLFSSDFCYLNC